MKNKAYVFILLLTASVANAQNVGNTYALNGLGYVANSTDYLPNINTPPVNFVQGPVLSPTLMHALPRYSSQGKNFVQNSALGVGLPTLGLPTYSNLVRGPTFPVGTQHALPTYGSPNYYPIGPTTNPYAMPSSQYGRVIQYGK